MLIYVSRHGQRMYTGFEKHFIPWALMKLKYVVKILLYLKGSLVDRMTS